MMTQIKNTSETQVLFTYILLAALTLAVFWQVDQFDFVNFDDNYYVTENHHIQSGLTPEGVRWAFSTKYSGLWNPLVWLSLMTDYQLYGLKAGGYHLTNRTLHILSVLLLFWLFKRMTGEIWKSAFVAAFFAVHPLHVESVAWIAERKDVLSAFFWMLTLCFYVYYSEKPSGKRYLPVLFAFACALMSKPMVVTLPVVMILLDYWPLKRFEFKKMHWISWQLKEKIPLLVLSAMMVVLLFYNPNEQETYLKSFPLSSRLANAPVAFVTYLVKTFWPYDMAVFYPFPTQIPIWQVVGATILIILISALFMAMMKQRPYLFVGWLWFTITIAPVIGILQISLLAPYSMADRYHYLPSIGLAVMMAWGIPALIKSELIRKKLLLPVGIAFLCIMALLAWNQCGYWKNSITLFSHALKVTTTNATVHHHLGLALFSNGKINEAIDHFNIIIHLQPDYLPAYIGRGNAYNKLGQYQPAIKDYNEAIRQQPYYIRAYINRGNVYNKLGQYQHAIKDYDDAIRLNPDFAEAYINRGSFYVKLNRYQRAIEDYNKAILLKPNYVEAYYKRGYAHAKLGQYQSSFDDYNQAIRLNPKYADVYIERGIAYGELRRYQQAIIDFNKALLLNADNAEAYYNRGFTFFCLGHHMNAIADYNQAIRLNPDHVKAFSNRGISYFYLGKYQWAINDFSEAIKLKQDNAEAYYNRGIAYKKVHNHQLADDDFDRAKRLRLKNPAN